MTRSAKKPAALYALVCVALLSAYGFWVFVGSLHGPTRMERVEMAVAFPTLALADHAGVLPDGGFFFWLLALTGFVFWFALFYCIALVLFSRSSRVSDV